jgi:hypothetical protein
MVEVIDKQRLAALYDSLLAATAAGDVLPASLLADATAAARAADDEAVEALPPRARVTMRLLRAGEAEPAWLVAIDSATGVVQRSFRASTSSGAPRADWALPLLTAVEPPHVYAELPGFRDPRYAAPDAAYEIGASIKLRCHVDEVIVAATPVFAGWAALDVLPTEPDDIVAVVATRDGTEIRWTGTRHRRADLVGGSRETLRRRAWAGWSVAVDPADLPAEGGRWALWLELGHGGLSRRARLGRSVGELARRVVGTTVCPRPATELVEGPGGWSLQRRR